MRTWALVFVGSLVLGSLIGAATPARWMFRWTDGILIGSALYVAGLHRFVERREVEEREAAGTGRRARSLQAMLPGLLLRSALFAAVLVGISALCFDVAPESDLRHGFVVLSTWVLLMTWSDRPVVSEASRLPFR